MARAPRQWLVIARREFVERVRSRWFVAVTLLGPVAMVAMIVIPALLARQAAKEEVVIVVVDDSPYDLASVVPMASVVLEANLRVDTPESRPTEEDLRRKIRDETIDGYLIVPPDIDDGGVVRYRGDNATNLQFVAVLGRIVNQAVQIGRAASAGLDEEQVGSLFSPVMLDIEHDTGSGEAKSGAASFIIGYASMFIIYMAIILYAVNVLRGVVQEKTSRVVEMVVSATRPRALMLGKIVGVGSVGLLQLGTWAIVALLLVRYRGAILGLFGSEGSGFAVPPITLVQVGVILLFFLLGYFLYAAIYAAIGAMVNSDQEGQQAQTPVVILLIVPVLCVQLVANDPRSTASELLTTIPLSSPILMPMRYILGGAGTSDVLLSLAILAASIGITVMIAARIYRVGILMYGKRPSLAELWRWLRH